MISQNIKKKKNKRKDTSKTCYEKQYKCRLLKKIETKSGCDKQFSLDTVQKIAKALEIDVKDLFNKLD